MRVGPGRQAGRAAVSMTRPRTGNEPRTAPDSRRSPRSSADQTPRELRQAASHVCARISERPVASSLRPCSPQEEPPGTSSRRRARRLAPSGPPPESRLRASARTRRDIRQGRCAARAPSHRLSARVAIRDALPQMAARAAHCRPTAQSGGDRTVESDGRGGGESPIVAMGCSTRTGLCSVPRLKKGAAGASPQNSSTLCVGQQGPGRVCEVRLVSQRRSALAIVLDNDDRLIEPETLAAHQTGGKRTRGHRSRYSNRRPGGGIRSFCCARCEKHVKALAYALEAALEAVISTDGGPGERRPAAGKRLTTQAGPAWYGRWASTTANTPTPSPRRIVPRRRASCGGGTRARGLRLRC